jgi:methylmalonyl-CoA mutase C-terminal domain/subunit
LRDAGFEVIYTGLHQTIENIVRAAIQEDVDCIGLSILSGAHMTLFPELLRKLEAEGASDISVFGGGIIPKDDIEALIKIGVKQIFIPGAHTQDVVAWIRANVPIHE